MNKLERRVVKLEQQVAPKIFDIVVINGVRSCSAPRDPIILWGWSQIGPPGETINEYRESIGLKRIDDPRCDEPRVITTNSNQN